LTAQPGMISYGRFDESGYAVVVVNVSESGQKLYVPVWRVGAPENDPKAICRVMLTGPSGYNVGRVPYETRDGYIVADLPPTSCAVFTGTDR
ncbi:MAG: alpha-glycosidase, partial [Lachnospiraceae bacterium]|nr:alpha-glycosidase [Lachnospiraceae bacterium]